MSSYPGARFCYGARCTTSDEHDATSGMRDAAECRAQNGAAAGFDAAHCEQRDPG